MNCFLPISPSPHLPTAPSPLIPTPLGEWGPRVPQRGPPPSPSPHLPIAPNPQRQVLYAGKPVHRTGSSLSVVGSGEFPISPSPHLPTL
ncbi:hypothetical protein [Fischerella sp. FACHB-380]|uniref:hypothetical protein n=1 Tax=Fischerella sp. FACHB-380 TaxID=2692799 RepID=UPI00168A2470|nr:hypothetical protein [Fischerella sp. FACHB-380]MBD2430243.1 hypothetical protein [Fischerella sp. FACHB-380]